jgi:hypothetical protein
MKIKVIMSIVTVMVFSFVTTSGAAETMQMRTAPVQKLKAAPSTSQLSQKVKAGTIVDQRIQQLIAKEELARKSEVQKIDQAIRAKMKTGSVQKKCASPSVTSVFPKEVKPGDPLLIEGCGFQTSAGSKAVMFAPNYKGVPFYKFAVGTSSPVNPELLIESWTDTAIKAKIPPLDSFSDFIPFTIRVLKGHLGQDKWEKASPPSPRIVLKPEMEIAVVDRVSNYIRPDIRGIVLLEFSRWPYFMRPGVIPTMPKIIHVSGPGIPNKGKDNILLQNLKLAKNWTFYNLAFNSYNIYEELSETTPGLGIIWGGQESTNQYVKLDPNLGKVVPNAGNIEGMTSLPNVSISWSYITGGIAYEILILAKGPKGTFP